MAHSPRLLAALSLACLPLAGLHPAQAQVTNCLYQGANCLPDRSNDGVLPAGSGTPQKLGDVIGSNVAAIKGLGARSANGTVLTYAGDSTSVYATYSAPAGSPIGAFATGFGANSFLGWAAAMSGGGIVHDPSMSYQGSQGALLRAIPLTPGSGCAPNAQVQAFPTASSGTQAGPFSFQTNAAGQAIVGQVDVVASPGSGYFSYPAVGGVTCAVGPTFAFITAGVNYGWGVPGDTTAGLLARIQYDTGVASVQPITDPSKSLIGQNPADVAILAIGTNDIAQGVPLATMQSNITQVVTLLRSFGTRVGLQGVTPRTVGSGGWTAAMDQQRLSYNRFLASLARQSRATNGGASPVFYIDLDRYLVDPANANGNALANAVEDGLHQSPFGAAIAGMEAVAAIKPATIADPANSQQDVYNATTNPGGNLITNGSFQAGSPTATGWSFTTGGTGTFTNTPSIETTRTDGLPGKRQVISISDASGGGANDFVLFQSTTGTSIIPNLTLGTDVIRASITIDISGMTSNFLYIGCELLETATASQASQDLIFGNTSGNATGFLPSSTQFASWDNAKYLTDYGKTGSGSFKVTLRTPPITTQVGATVEQIYCIARMNATASTAAVVLKFGDAKINKVLPGQFN